MSVVKRLFKFYIKASIHVALSVCVLTWITGLTLQINIPLYFYLFVFMASVGGYNFIKYGHLIFNNKNIRSFSLKSILGFSFICFLITFVWIFFLPIEVLKLLVVLGVLTFFYAFPFYKQKNLRAITGLKLILVALVWAGVTVLLPIIYSGFTYNQNVGFLFLQRFLFVIVLTLPFEIRDLKNDDDALGTLPQRVGIKNTKKLGVLLSVIIVVLQFWISQDILQLSSLILTLLILNILLFFTKKNQGVYYTAFWVESIPILWAILILLLMKISFFNNSF